MADSKISALTDGANAQSGDEFVIARSGADYKLSADELGLVLLPGKVLFESTLGADATSIDTGAGGVSTSYKHLLVLVSARTDGATVDDVAMFNFNGDTGANYARNYWKVGLGGSTQEAGSGETAIKFICSTPGANANANVFGSGALLITDYANTSKNKSFLVLAFNPGNLSTWGAKLGGGYWASTAAISRIAVSPQTGTHLKAGSTLTVLGLP